MQKDRVVLKTTRGVDKKLRHLTSVQLALRFGHLKPLAVFAVARMHLPERLHGQEEDEFKMRHAPGR